MPDEKGGEKDPREDVGIMRRFRAVAPTTRTVSIRAFGGTDGSVGRNAGGFSYADLCENFDPSDGELKSAKGFAPLSQSFAFGERKASAVYFYKRTDAATGRDDRLVFCCDDGYLYDAPVAGGSLRKINGMTFSAPPNGIRYRYNGEDVMLFSRGSEGLWIYDGTSATRVEDAPPVSSMCIHYERLFATDESGECLWFSDDFDPSNWCVSLDEAGFIMMNGPRGDLLKVVSFFDYLYVFRSYGITRVTAYAEQTKFSLSDLYVSSGKIDGGSIVTCGDRILYCASDGFYRFDGVSAGRILKGLDDKIDFSSPVEGKFYDGKAYFTVFLKENGKKYFLVYDPKSEDHYFVSAEECVDYELIDGETIYDLYLLTGVGNVLYHPEGLTFFGAEKPRRWISKEGAFSLLAKKKCLKKIAFCLKGGVTVKVKADGTEKSYEKKENGKVAVLHPGVTADEFRISFEGTGEIEISGLTLTFSYYDGTA